MEDQELTQPRGSAAFFGRGDRSELRAVIGSPAEAGGSYYERTQEPGARQSTSTEPRPSLLSDPSDSVVVMGQSNRIKLAVLFLSLITPLRLPGPCSTRHAESIFPGFNGQRSSAFWRVSETTFAAVPDLVSMLKRRARAGMYPMMAAIMGTFQILWVYYGI